MGGGGQGTVGAAVQRGGKVRGTVLGEQCTGGAKPIGQPPPCSSSSYGSLRSHITKYLLFCWIIASIYAHSAHGSASTLRGHFGVPKCEELLTLTNEEMRNAFHWDVGCRQPSENTKKSSQSL